MLMRFVIVVISFITIQLQAQNQANNWFFGNSAGMSFAGSSPSVVSGGAITNSLGCSSISDALGNLLFYTDGVTVYNQTHSVMANGSGLHGLDASQSALIIKQPLSSTIYYIFTVGGWNTSEGLKYSIVDMALAAGLGSVTTKNVVLDNTCRDKLSAGKHCNGTDIWVVSTQSSTAFSSFLLNSTGINNALPIVSSLTQNLKGLGQLKIAPNSRKLAITTLSYSLLSSPTIKNALIALFDFDNSTGLINAQNQTNLFFLQNSNLTVPNIYNCEFSPNSMQLYYSNGSLVIGSYLSRYDLCAPLGGGAVFNSETNVQDSINKRSMQLGPNGRIYVAKNGKASLGYIASPNNTGPPASYVPSGLSLGTFSCAWGLPNFPGYYFEQKPFPSLSYTVDPSTCLTATFSNPNICTASGYSISGYQWQFGDPSSGSNNTSALQSPSHVYSSTGVYTVTLIRSFYCNTNDTITQLISFAQPSLSIVKSSNYCLSTSATVSVNGGIGPFSYSWSANSQTNTSASFVSSGIYTVAVTDIGSGYCTKTATTNISVTVLSTSVSTNSILCNGQNNGSATIAVAGGSGIYQYTWSSGTSSLSNISSLSAGAHSVNILDIVDGCSISNTFTIAQAPPFNLNVSANTYSACVNQSIQITANSSGGNPQYAFLWSTMANTNSIITTQTLSGNYVYTCMVMDANSCTKTDSVKLTFFEYPLLNCSNASVCKGNTLLLFASGANSYTWQPSSSNSSTLGLTPFTDLTYTLYGKSNGCTSSTLINVIVHPLPNVNIISNSPLCVGQTLSLSSTGVYNSFWSGPLSYSSNIQNPFLNNVSANQSGFYYLTVIDTNFCTITKNIQVLVNNLPTINIYGKQTICIGESTMLNVNGTLSYLWLNNNTTGSNITVSPASTITYSVTGTNNATGCSNTASFVLNVAKCNGLFANSIDLEIKIYPNPTNGNFTIETPEDAEIKIINTLGQLIFENNLNKGISSLELIGNKKGLYFISLEFKNTKICKKLVLN